MINYRTIDFFAVPFQRKWFIKWVCIALGHMAAFSELHLRHFNLICVTQTTPLSNNVQHIIFGHIILSLCGIILDFQAKDEFKMGGVKLKTLFFQQFMHVVVDKYRINVINEFFMYSKSNTENCFYFGNDGATKIPRINTTNTKESNARATKTNVLWKRIWVKLDRSRLPLTALKMTGATKVNYYSQ